MSDLNENGRKRLYLVDASSFIFRAYHSLPPLSRPDGTPVGAVLGYSNMLLRIIEDKHCDYIACIFDTARITFRNEIYDLYKANRDAPPEDLRPQFAIVREATKAFNVACVELEGFEADDLIAAYAKEATAAGYETVIVSSDKDLMQLINDQVMMLDTMKNREIREPEVFEKFGVGPNKVVDIQALAGDSVDNVPGVPGIGVKTAALLINEYGDLDTLLERAGEIKQNKRRENLIEFADQARMSRELVRLKDDMPLPVPMAELVKREAEPDVLRPFLEFNGFGKLMARLGASMGDAPASHAVLENSAEKSYELVTTLEQLDSWIKTAAREGLLAVDTETTSIDATSAKLVGISMAITPNKACYIPLEHKDVLGSKLDGQIETSEAIARLKPLLEDPSVMKVGHNMKYDMTILHNAGIDVFPVDDTMLMSYVLEAGQHGHGMDELAGLFLNHVTIKFKDVAGSGKSQVTFDYVELDKALDYAAEDADITLQLYHLFKSRLPLEQMTTLYETIERPLIPVLAEIEQAGITVDKEKLRLLSHDFAQRAAELEKEIHSLAGETFNVASPKQLGEVLFDKLGMPGGKKGKTGAYGTGADVLESLVAQGFDLPSKVMERRQVEKLRSTYTDALQEQINPATGRVHTSFAMAIASTGRLSSTDPNLQNIPVRTEEGRKIREAFIPAAGCTLLSIDYSQIELRLTAHIANEPALKQAFHDGLDIHAMTAAQVFGVPIEGMDPMVRRQAKAINFGIIYGISAFGLANNLAIPQHEAKTFIAAYFERFPGIKTYMAEAKAFCHEHGYVETLFGRRIHLKGIADKNGAVRSFAERQAINAPIQGTAADIIKRAMIQIPAALKNAELSAKMLLTVHDELLFEVVPDEVDRTIAVVRDVMENAHRPVIELSVPIVADAGQGINWAEAH